MMEDDIDIEEHDVLYNPAVKNVFPDLSVVKNEILDLGIDESPPRNVLFTKIQSAADSTTDSKDDIIKNEKPKVVSSSNVKTTSSDSNIIDLIDDHDDDSKFYGNRIIVGSKRRIEETEDRSRAITKKYMEMEKCLNVKLVLKDWGITLWKSKSYCSLCRILFPSISAFDNHKLKVHTAASEVDSFDEIVSKSGVWKKTTEHQKTAVKNIVIDKSLHHYITSELNTSAVEESINKYITSKIYTPEGKTGLNEESIKNDAAKPCSHCSEIFATKEELISHLYEVLTYKFECAQCHNKFETQEKLVVHSKTHQNDRITSKNTSKSETAPPHIFYVCKICTCYFNLKTEWKQHMSLFHSKCTSYICDADVFKSNCHFCNLRFHTIVDYNAHILKVHRNEKNNKKRPLDTSTVGDEADAAKTDDCTDFSNLVPNSVLLVCTRCKLHFVTRNSADKHMCELITIASSNAFNCAKCNRKIINSDKEVHEKQHLICKNFKIIDRIVSRTVLHQCPKCGVHFNDWRFNSHCCERDRTTPQSTYCKKCDILVDNYDNYHTHSHLSLKMQREDFIIIGYQILDTNKPDELRNNKILAVENSNKPKRSKFNDDASTCDEDCHSADDSHLKPALDVSDYSEKSADNIELSRRYCHHCNSIIEFQQSSDLNFHITQRCQKKNLLNDNCSGCGLNIPLSSLKLHKPIHSAGHTLYDIRFYALKGFQRINPPLLSMFQYCSICSAYCLRNHFTRKCDGSIRGQMCGKCDANFAADAFRFHMMYHEYEHISWKRRHYTLYRCHKCSVMTSEDAVEAHKTIKYDCASLKEIYKKCKYCGYSLVGKYYKEHMKQHEVDPNYGKHNIRIINFNNDMEKDESEPLKSDGEENSSDDDYEAKYTIYQCSDCLCCMKKKSMSMHSCHNLLRLCKYCGNKFSSSAMSHHYKLHELCPDMTKDNIKIIKFNTKNIIRRRKRLKNICATPTPKSPTTKVSKTNLPNVDTDSFKNEIYELYQCRKCKFNYYENVMDSHECLKRIPFICLECNLYFKQTDYEEHTRMHKLRPDYTLDLIKIIYFGQEQSSPTQCDDTLTEQPAASTSQIQEDLKDNDDVVTVYVCSCGLHYFSYSDLLIHLKLCGKQKISKQNCAKCKLLFTPQVLFDHLLTHHGKMKKEFKYNVVDYTKSDVKKDHLYKCRTCDLLHVEKLKAEKHFESCEGTSKRKTCAFCGLGFSPDEIAEHLSRHHNKIDFEAKDFDIITVNMNAHSSNVKIKAKMPSLEVNQLIEDDDVVELLPKEDNEDNIAPDVDSSMYKNILYKCTQCDIHYLSRQKLEEHVFVKNHEINDPTQPCQICGYRFSIKGLRVHNYLHHKMLKLKSDGFIFEEYNERSHGSKLNLNVLFKCRECKIYFISEDLIYSHVKSYHLILKTTKLCKICKLSFSSSSYAKHVNLHHEKYNLKPEDIEIREYPFLDDSGKEIEPNNPKPKKTNTSNQFSNKVFKCVECDLNFMTKCALKNHVHVQNPTTVTCDECGLKFPSLTVAKHKAVHHEKMRLKLDNIIIVTQV